jgi:hypothetical protein
MFKLLGHPLISRNDLVERIADLAFQAGVLGRQAGRKITRPHRLQGMQEFVQTETVAIQPVAAGFPIVSGGGGVNVRGNVGGTCVDEFHFRCPLDQLPQAPEADIVQRALPPDRGALCETIAQKLESGAEARPYVYKYNFP